jgi:D-serine deaminase-like pyridoxal phosphate-dependent protein
MSSTSPVLPGTPIAALPTPCLVVDERRLAANLARAQAYADAQGVALRPHAKTHKSPVLAREQLAAGAVGVCVAKLGEAEVFADAGIDDIVMANTTVGADNARRAARLARRIRFAIGVDHPHQIDDLAHAAQAEGARLAVRIEVDAGSGRGGADPAEVPDLLARIADAPALEAQGLYAYEGFTYAARDRADLVTRHRAAQDLMADLATRLADRFPRRPVVSLGSTPSLSAAIPLRPEIDEVRPGTAVFFDAQQADLAGGLDHCAAHVLATVVSRSGDRAILDAGSKSLTSDGIREGVLAVRGFGSLRSGGTVARVSEEHGVVEGPEAQALAVGDRVEIVPNHVCPVVNLFDRLVLVEDGQVTRILPVATRGRVA